MLDSSLNIQLTSGIYVLIADTHVIYESGHEQLENEVVVQVIYCHRKRKRGKQDIIRLYEIQF